MPRFWPTMSYLITKLEGSVNMATKVVFGRYYICIIDSIIVNLLLSRTIQFGDAPLSLKERKGSLSCSLFSTCFPSSDNGIYVSSTSQCVSLASGNKYVWISGSGCSNSVDFEIYP